MKHIKLEMSDVVVEPKSRPVRIESKIALAESVMLYKLKLGLKDSASSLSSFRMILNLIYQKIKQDHCS